MAKIVKRIDIVLVIDTDKTVMTRSITISKNLNTYEVIGILDSLRVDSLQALTAPKKESEVEPDEPE